MNTEQFEKLFQPKIFPGFPFRNGAWIAMAFERDNYDNTRLPERFFNQVAERFGAVDKGTLCIKGFGGLFSEAPDGIVRIPFRWPDYRRLLLSPGHYSLQYKMAGDSGSWACWADPELTVWGGDPVYMEPVVKAYGGFTKALEMMRKEFFLSDLNHNSEIDNYLTRLLTR